MLYSLLGELLDHGDVSGKKVHIIHEKNSLENKIFVLTEIWLVLILYL